MAPPQVPLPPRPSLAKAAGPRHTTTWDPWNSSSTGHQRAETQPGTGWRDSRSKKLNSQFRAGDGSGGARLSDTYGAGSANWDNEKKVIVPGWIQERNGRSVMDMLVRPGLMRESMAISQQRDASSLPSLSATTSRAAASHGGIALPPIMTAEEALVEQRQREDEEKESQAKTKKLFDGVVIYVNGSTFPLVSDHKLKQLLSENGGQMFMHLGRRRVTHVILGRPAGSGNGAGGGLAGGKLEKEVKKIGGCSVKFVGVEWYVPLLGLNMLLSLILYSDLTPLYHITNVSS